MFLGSQFGCYYLFLFATFLSIFFHISLFQFLAILPLVLYSYFTIYNLYITFFYNDFLLNVYSLPFVPHCAHLSLICSSCFPPPFPLASLLSLLSQSPLAPLLSHPQYAF